jgi:DNA end-binding protein Ku
VHEFVRSNEIDPLFRDHVYYLQPDGQDKGYGALLAALGEADVEGICTWTMRKRTYLGDLQARGKLLRLTTLRFADEVIAAKSLELPESPLSEREVKMGTSLVEQLAGAFEPETFTNEHEAKLAELIEKKARGEKVAVVRPRRLAPTASDKLLKALEASLRKSA